jgi:hypothetical protein
MSATDSEFDWAEDPAVVQQRVPSLAVYTNPMGLVVIRQEAEWDEDSDPFLLIHPTNALAVAQAILREAGYGDDLRPALPEVERHAAPPVERIADSAEPKPKDATAAERMRRHRKRHRNVTADDAVTHRNGDDEDRNGHASAHLFPETSEEGGVSVSH